MRNRVWENSHLDGVSLSIGPILLRIFNTKYFRLVIPFCFCILSFQRNILAADQGSENLPEPIKSSSSIKDFETSECGSKERRTFESLLKGYRSEGYFIPELKPGVLHRQAIKDSEALQREKLLFVETQLKNLSKANSYRHLRKKFAQLEKIRARDFEIRKKVFSGKAKTSELNEASLALNLKKVFGEFLQSAPFLRSFKSPVDHLWHRKKDQELKGKEEWSAFFLKRKIVEDGTFNSKNSRSDLFLRSTLDSLELAMGQPDFPKHYQSNFNFRRELWADLDFVFGEVKKILKQPKKEQIMRMALWKKRVAETLDFYESITSDRQPSGLSDFELRWQKQSQARWSLLEFVMAKQARLYQAISRLPLEEQKIYVIEKILFNEVPLKGAISVDEKRDVARVVLARSSDSFYSQLSRSDRLFDYLIQSGMSEAQIKKNVWANVLLKEGEFSFTYFYMPGVFDLFCHRSKKDKEIAQQIMKDDPRKDFALRYYSRSAMVGRVPMEKVWTDHEVRFTQVGHLVESPLQKKLEKYLKNDRLEYWGYSPEAKRHLLQWKGLFVWFDAEGKGNTRWSYFRDPDQFRFLYPKSTT